MVGEKDRPGQQEVRLGEQDDGPAEQIDEPGDQNNRPDERQDPAIIEAPIDENTLQILGVDPSVVESREVKFHSNPESRWKSWITTGLKKEERNSLLDKYPRTGTCPIEAPALNPELQAPLNDTSIKRDKHFIDSQKIVGSAMSALGSAITLVLNEKEEMIDKMKLLELMCDAGKLLSDLHHKESVARRVYILPGLDKSVRTVMEKIETDSFLFGKDLAEKLRLAKSVEKVGLGLKPTEAPKAPKTPLRVQNSLNWKGPPGRFQRANQVGSNQRSSSYFKSPKSGPPQGQGSFQRQTQAPGPSKSYQKPAQQHR